MSDLIQSRFGTPGFPRGGFAGSDAGGKVFASVSEASALVIGKAGSTAGFDGRVPKLSVFAPSAFSLSRGETAGAITVAGNAINSVCGVLLGAVAGSIAVAAAPAVVGVALSFNFAADCPSASLHTSMANSPIHRRIGNHRGYQPVSVAAYFGAALT
jgi:hypothetical protein